MDYIPIQQLPNNTQVDEAIKIKILAKDTNVLH